MLTNVKQSDRKQCIVELWRLSTICILTVVRFWFAMTRSTRDDIAKYRLSYNTRRSRLSTKNCQRKQLMKCAQTKIADTDHWQSIHESSENVWVVVNCSTNNTIPCRLIVSSGLKIAESIDSESIWCISLSFKWGSFELREKKSLPLSAYAVCGSESAWAKLNQVWTRKFVYTNYTHTHIHQSSFIRIYSFE